MKLSILTPKETKFKGEAKSLNIKTSMGEITVLDNHEPIISMFKKCQAIFITNDNKKHEIEVEPGFLEMTSENELTLLTD